METKAKRDTVTSIKYRDLTISVNSLLIAIISVIFIFIFSISGLVAYYQYKFTELKLNHQKELKMHRQIDQNLKQIE